MKPNYFGLWFRLSFCVTAVGLAAATNCDKEESDDGICESVSSADTTSVLQSTVFISNSGVAERNAKHATESVSPLEALVSSMIHPALQEPLKAGSFKRYKVWWLGVLLCLLGCLSSATGILLMKNSGETESHLVFYRRYRWMAGVFLLIVNASVLDMLAYSLMPLALMAPFSGVTIVFSTILAQSGWLTTKEEITRSQWMSIAIVCIGVAAISVCGPRTSHELTEDSIKSHLSSLQFDVFAGVGFIAVVMSMLLWLCQQRSTVLSVVVFALGSSTAGAFSQISLKVISNSLRGYFNGHTALFSLPFSVGLWGLITFAPPQLFLLNTALLNSGVAFAVSLYQTLLILVTIVAGYTFFDEFALVTYNWMLVFCSGVVFSLGGLVSLTRDEMK